MYKVSIIVPIYNGEKYLNRCIDSLLNQSYKNNEYIFVNDGSSDNTLSILKQYAKNDKRIIIIDKENTGVSDSRNMGIEKAIGDYVCFCDCDDMYEENYIETMLKLAIDEDVSLVKCNFKVINKNGQIIDNGKNYFSAEKLNHEKIINDIIPYCLGGEIPCFTYLLMIKNDALNVKFPTDIAMMEDVVFYINLLLNAKSMYVTEKSLYTIMFNEEGATNNVKNYKRNINNVVLVNKYIKNILKKNGLMTSENVSKLNINHLNSIADFIFRYYLYGNDNPIDFCKEIRTEEFLKIINETDLSLISLPRRFLLKLINKKHYNLLMVYFVLRKIIFKFKRR